MNRLIQKTMGLAAAAVFVLPQAAFSVCAQAAESQDARNIAVLSIDGKNAVVKKGGKKELKATSGMRLSAGSTVSTGSDTVLYIQADDDKFVKLSENSEVSVSQASTKKLRVSVKSGEIFFNVVKPLEENSELTFTAGNVSMGVRGTSGGISLNQSQDGDWQQVSLTLSSGKVDMVDLLTGSTLPLQAGETGVSSSSGGALERTETSAETVSSFFLHSALEQSVTLTTIDPVLSTPEAVTERIQKKAKTETAQKEQAAKQRQEIEKSLPAAGDNDSLTPLNPDVSDSKQKEKEESESSSQQPSGGGSSGSKEEDKNQDQDQNDGSDSGSDNSNSGLRSLRSVGMPEKSFTTKNVIRLKFKKQVPDGYVSLNCPDYHYYQIRNGVVTKTMGSGTDSLVSMEDGGKTLVVRRAPLGSNSSAYSSAYFSLKGYHETNITFRYTEEVEADGGVWTNSKPTVQPDQFSDGTFTLEADKDEDFNVEFTVYLPHSIGSSTTISDEQYLGRFTINSQDPDHVVFTDNLDSYVEVSTLTKGNGKVQVDILAVADFNDKVLAHLPFLIVKKDCPNEYTCVALPQVA